MIDKLKQPTGIEATLTQILNYKEEHLLFWSGRCDVRMMDERRFSVTMLEFRSKEVQKILNEIGVELHQVEELDCGDDDVEKWCAIIFGRVPDAFQAG